MRLSFDPPPDAAAYAWSHQLRVRFAETDAMGIVHHAAYLPYLEEARVEYLRHLGYIADGVEDVELDEMQGVHGLRALRVTVALRESLDGRPVAALEAARVAR